MKMYLLKKCLVVFLLLLVNSVQAQLPVDSMQSLPAVEVSSYRLSEFSSGIKIETFDSTLLTRYSSNNLADLLANESQVFIKSYGLGSLATTSFRGAGASHTAILWNGFNLQSARDGLIDMSLIPIIFLNTVDIQYGGSGALWGSGAVGGSVHLKSEGIFEKGFSAVVNASVGSFLDKQKQLSLEISKKRFASSFKLFYHDAKNNFPFQNIAQRGKPEMEQINASLKQYGVLQENYFKINAHQKLNTRFWYQNSDRKIPPSMTESGSASNQKDESLRLTSEWERSGGKVQVLVRAAYFRDALIYTDSLIDLLSNSITNTFISEVETRFSISRFDLLNIGINNTYNEASNKNYLNNPEQNRTAFFASYKIHTKNNKLTSTISGRQEYINGKAIPFTSSLGVEFKPVRYISITSNVAQHYRVPTFNDLYWSPGGNPDLKPEKGWSEEVSLIHKHFYKVFNWEIGATAFNRNIDNWIIWLPNQFGNWSPDNVLKVWSRGLEYKLNFGCKFKDYTFQVKGLYNYVLSTNEEASTTNDPSLNKQLIYVPVQNFQGSLFFSYKRTSLSYTQVYTGYRYTLSDNSKFLSPYTISNVSLEQMFLLEHSTVKVYAQLNNIFDEVYQVIAYRAMPLLNYKVGLTFYFNRQNEKTN